MNYVLPEISRYRGEFLKNYVLIGRAEGCRVIVENDCGFVRIYNSRGEDRTKAFKRVCAELEVGQDSFIVEAELLVNGELFQTGQMCRRTVRRVPKIETWSMSFTDILEGYLGDEPIDVQTPTEKRMEALRELTERTNGIPNLAFFTPHDDYKKLRNQAVATGNIGVIYKKKGLPHQCSISGDAKYKSSLYQRLVFLTEDFYVGGGYYGNGKNSDMLGGVHLFSRTEDGMFIYIGRSGIHNQELNREVCAYIEDNLVDDPPMPLERREDNIFCRMGELKVTLNYKGISSKGGFYFPAVKSLTYED